MTLSAPIADVSRDRQLPLAVTAQQGPVSCWNWNGTGTGDV